MVLKTSTREKSEGPGTELRTFRALHVPGCPQDPELVGAGEGDVFI